MDVQDNGENCSWFAVAMLLTSLVSGFLLEMDFTRYDSIRALFEEVALA